MRLEDGKVERIMGLIKTKDYEEALWKPTNLKANLYISKREFELRYFAWGTMLLPEDTGCQMKILIPPGLGYFPMSYWAGGSYKHPKQYKILPLSLSCPP